MTSLATANLFKWIPPAIWNTETQTVALTVLCFIGAWVVVTKLIQFVFSILWPLIVLGGILIMAPTVSVEWLTENVPIYVSSFVDWIKKCVNDVNASIHKNK